MTLGNTHLALYATKRVELFKGGLFGGRLQHIIHSWRFMIDLPFLLLSTFDFLLVVY